MLPGAGGNGGSGGAGGAGGQNSGNFACTEDGVRNAIAAGGGPNTIDCDGPTRVTTSAEIVINNDVIVDGSGDLILDGNDDHRVFGVAPGKTVELRGMTITNGNAALGGGLFVDSAAVVTLAECTVSDSFASTGGGIVAGDGAHLTIVDSTVSGNTTPSRFELGNAGGIGIAPGAVVSLLRSSVSQNYSDLGAGIWNGGELSVTNSTMSGNVGFAILAVDDSSTTLTNTTIVGIVSITIDGGTFSMINSILDGSCLQDAIASGGDNIESPGDSCGLRGIGDQVSVTTAQLNIGPLAQNGGPTESHEPGPGSVAIDVIDAADCEVADDQRGVERAQGVACDVGSVEVSQ